MLRDIIPRDIREGAPGWKWRWWMCDETEIPTVEEVRDFSRLNWGPNILTAVADAGVFIYQGRDTSIDCQFAPKRIAKSKRTAVWCLGFIYFLKQIAVRVDYVERRRDRYQPPRSA